MALHNIKIVVVDGGRSGSYKSKNAGVGEKVDKEEIKKSPLYNLLHLRENLKRKFQKDMTPTQIFAMNYTAQVALNTIKQGVNYFVSDIGRSNGDNNFQALVNRNIEIVTDVLGVVGGAWSGAKIGSTLGPVGAGIGAVAGAITSGISIGFRQMERERAYQHEMFEQNTSQAYNLARANYSVWTGRVR